jgi:5-hydroxyisourate hydrolase
MHQENAAATGGELEMNQALLTRRNVVATGVLGSVIASSSLAMAQTGAQQPGTLTTAPVSQSGLSPRLTLHAIDTFHGTPGAGMKCDLSVLEGDRYRAIKSVVTAENGRTAEPLLSDEALRAGRYELLLHLEEYFQKWNVRLPTPNFLRAVPVRFVIRDIKQRYHVPILFSPWGYSYYRGS